jgi:LacI family transcriptional regulator
MSTSTGGRREGLGGNERRVDGQSRDGEKRGGESAGAPTGDGRPDRRVTMRDVARRAEVSQSTVSFVINETPNVRIAPATRIRVLDAIRDLGYRRNAMAHGLRLGTSAVIGFITDAIATTPFAGQVIRGAQDAAWAEQNILLVVNTDSSAEVEEQAVAMMLEHRVRGIVYSTWYHRPVRLPPGIEEVPTILVNCFSEDHELPAVVSDEAQGGYLATQTLISKGHRRVGFLNAPPSVAPATTRRLDGYRAALERAGIQPRDDLVIRTEAHQEGGYEGAFALLRRPERPTALFCYNDRMAMGAYAAIAELGLSIPQDVAVIGFDNQEVIAAHLRPPLTTIALPHYEMGHRGLARLLELVKTGAEDTRREALPCPLVLRESV